MTPDQEEELYGQLDFCIILVSSLIITGYFLSYSVMPQVIPGEAKVGMVDFLLGTSCLKYVRRPGDPAFTVDDFPEEQVVMSKSLATYNVEYFAEQVDGMWNHRDKAKLLSRLLRHMVVWWGYSMFMFGAERLTNFVGMSYTFPVLVTLLTSERLPGWGPVTLKLMFLGFTQSVGANALNQWCKLIMSLRGTDPLYAGMSLLVIRKMQRLSASGLVRTSAAEAQQITQECYNLAVSFWVSPLQTCLLDVVLGAVSLWKLYALVGLAGMALAAVCIVVMFGVGALCDLKKKDIDASTYAANVRRQETLNHLLDSFRELRLYDWVERAAKPLDGVRSQIRVNSLWSTLYTALGACLTSQVDGIMTVSTCFFIVFVRHEKVSFADAQTARAVMGALLLLVGSLSFCRMSWMDMVQRAQRIEAFMRLPEVTDQQTSEGPMQVAGASFAYAVPPKYDEAGEDITPAAATVLSGVDFKPQRGELVLVCGAIGAGKTSFLQALLGELPMTEGERWVPSESIAYQPQVPYLIEGSIRENVLFGVSSDGCDEKHLQRALAAAQLAVDIRDPGSTLHAKGDGTDVGKRGTHLSGGQRARTALARSVYAVLRGAPIALLDDPVASVDNEVVQAAWEEAVLGAMKGATRVVVVNSQLLERLAATADRLVVLSEGRVAFCGTPDEAFKDQEVLGKALSGKYELSKSASRKQAKAYTWLTMGVAAVKDYAAFFGHPKEGDAFTEEHLGLIQKSSPTPLTFESLTEQGLVRESEAAEAEEPVPQRALPAPEPEEEEANGEDSALALADMLRESEPLRDFLRCQIPGSEEDTEPLLPSRAPLKLSPDEWESLRLKLQRIERQHRHGEPQGKAKLTTAQLVMHFLYVSAFMFAICMCLQVGSSFKDAAVLATISRWGAKSESESDTAYLWTLIWVFVGFALLGVLIQVLDGYGSLQLSVHLMGRVDESLVALGMPFFWRKKQLAEPQIRKVVNTDMGALANIARMPMMCIECLVLIAATSLHAPLVLVLMPVSFVGYYRMAFLPDWRNLQLYPAREQLQNAAWAKVVEQFDMLPAIRGLKRQHDFQRKTYRGIMVVGYSNFMDYQLQVLSAVYHHVIGAIFNAVALAVLIRMRSSGTDATTAYAFWTLVSNVNGRVNQLVNMYMPFKDLLKQYDQMQDIFCSDALETDEGAEAPPGWPAEGKIEFESVTFRYVAFLPPALKDVSLVVRPGEKLGVVGKTGSGKSTLMSLLLRLGPLKGVAPNSGGRVLLDGVDVATLRLTALRQRVAVVPQEPTLFAMTLKENVGEEFTDAEVLTALQWCGLEARQLTGKEEGPIADALTAALRPGSLSVGQQQLLMAARALVRRPRVLVLDECTASLDRESADRLLEVLNTHSKDATVLAIAHRLRFVLRSDRILVLSAGKVLACDTPARLLEQPDSYFAVNLRYEQQQEGGE